MLVTERTDLDRTKRLLPLVWGEDEGFVFLPWRSKHSWSEVALRSVPKRLVIDSFEPLAGAEHYFCPLVFSQPHRRAEYALPTRVLWADLDAADPNRVRLRPSVAWETSQGVLPLVDDGRLSQPPHYQALWFLDHEVPAAEAAALSKRIAYAEPGCDRSGWDVTQVLRLPGTLNHKYDPPAEVRFLWATKHAYTLAEVETAYPQSLSAFIKPEVFPELVEYGTTVSIEWWHTALPVGVQYELERSYDGRDRSAWLFKTAQLLLTFDVPPAVAVELLRRTPMNKFAGRSDETKQLRQTVSDALEKR